MENYYKQQIEKIQLELQVISKKINLLVWLRLTSFLFFIFSLVLLSLIEQRSIAWMLIVLSIVVFFYSVKIHLDKIKYKNFLEKLLQINQNELLVLKNEYTHFYNGEEYSEFKHPYSSDLNILGHASVFQYINRTVTIKGREKLIENLLNPNFIYNIKKAQEVSIDLTSKPEWRQKFQALGSEILDQKNRLNSFHYWLEAPNLFLQKKLLLKIVNFLPFLSFSALIISYFTGVYILAELLFGIQLIITLFHAKQINKIHEQLNQQFATLNSYADLMEHVAFNDFKAEKLIEAQHILIKNKENASSQMKKLAGILNAFDRRMNIIAAFLLNTAYMADLKNTFQLEKWKETNRKHIDEWLNALAEFDIGISLATFSFNNPEYTFPEISTNQIFNATNLGHPLLGSSKRVCNDFKITNEGEFVILTGANMAGKSTFLRTVGVNLILAMNGAPVCASSFIFKPLKVMTSISVKDSLFENESYFYAELLRLKSIIETLEKGDSIFIILDEILKGTNSNDKLSGSFSLMKKLIQYKASGIVATHDIALGELEKEFPDNIHNFSFEVSLEDDKLFYDYKLQKGSCKNLNASFLMRKMGITS